MAYFLAVVLAYLFCVFVLGLIWDTVAEPRIARWYDLRRSK